MKIIKRSGTEVVFDMIKIRPCGAQSQQRCCLDQRLTKEPTTCHCRRKMWPRNARDAGHTVSVEEIQDLVEDDIMQSQCV